MHGSQTFDGREHDMTYAYTPSKKDEDKYALFTINEHVDHHRAVAQPRQSMEIENEYKTSRSNSCRRQHRRITQSGSVLRDWDVAVQRLADGELHPTGRSGRRSR